MGVTTLSTPRWLTKTSRRARTSKYAWKPFQFHARSTLRVSAATVENSQVWFENTADPLKEYVNCGCPLDPLFGTVTVPGPEADHVVKAGAVIVNVPGTNVML
jgi:hypothetical protein